MRAAALIALAFDGGDTPVLAHANLELDVGFRPAAMSDESFLAGGDDAHAAVGLARKQRSDQFNIERLGAAAKASTHVWFDHADARHIHAESLRQHQMDVIGHLSGSMH